MPSIKDTLSSQTTTPFERQRGRSDTFDSRATTPFEGRRARRSATLEVNSAEVVAVHPERLEEPSSSIGWLIVVACVGLVGAVLWAAGVGF